MNAPPSEGSESTIDIFVLSKNQTEVPARMAPLEQNGYRITIFDDPPTLIESLHGGKPNLLICDTLSFPEAYDLCRHIKDDNDLWVIPVLILTGASDLSDLLHILDCNADNYIAYPYDPEYFLSLIDGILSTPVDRPTPEQIKTQFKIQHDDRIFVVTADRRKLLEFLLSSFEIAVTKFHDLSRATDEIHVLSDDVKRLEMFVDGQKQTVEELTSSLREKERANGILEQALIGHEQDLRDKTGEIDRLIQDLEADKTLLGAAEDQLRTLIRNRDESERQSVTEISDLRQQVTSLTADLDATTAALQESRNAYALEQSGRAGDLASLAEITQGKELAERSARALTLENEQMKASLSAEKTRAVAAEQETRSVLLAKSESEQVLTAIINELKETAKQQALDLHRQKAEMADGKNQVLNLEIQLGNLRTDKETTESALRAATERLQQDLASTRERLDAAQATLDEKDLEIERMSVSYNEVLGERDTAVTGLQALSGELRSIQHALEEEKEHHRSTDESLNAVIRERDAALQSLQGSHQAVRADLAEHRDDLAQARLDLASAIAGRSTLERDLEAVSAKMRDLEGRLQEDADSRELADQKIRSLSDELENVNAALETERRMHNATVESLRSSALENERHGQDIRTMSDQLASLQAALASEKELRSFAEAGNEELRRDLEADGNRSRSQEAALAATIESLRAELSSASHLRQELESRVLDLTRDKQHAEERAGSLADEIDQARTALADEWEDHMNDQNQLTVAAHEKRRAEERAGSLADEIDQARLALADEWEDHMNDRDQLTAAAREREHVGRSLPGAEVPDAEKARKRAIIIKGPDLPMEIRAASRALTTPGLLHEPPSDAIRITGVEDLFEDDDVTGDAGTTPTVSIIQESSGDPDWVPPMPDLPDLVQYPDETTTPPREEGLPGDSMTAGSEAEGMHEIPDDVAVEDENGDGKMAENGYPDNGDGADEDTPADSPAEGPSGDSADSIPPGIAFNRAQWFDLLKWAHHSGALSPEQRMQIVRMGRLIQKGRRLTRKQDEQVREMIALVQAHGYRFS